MNNDVNALFENRTSNIYSIFCIDLYNNFCYNIYILKLGGHLWHTVLKKSI